MITSKFINIKVFLLSFVRYFVLLQLTFFVTGTSKQNASHFIRKQHLKRIAVTPEGNALYDRLTRVGVKLSKCRSEINEQAIKIKCLQNLNTHTQFVETLENLYFKTFDSPAIQRTQERR